MTVLLFLGYFAIYLFSFFYSICVVITIIKNKNHHTVSFAIALEVVVINMIFMVISGINIVLGAVAEEWLLGWMSCTTSAYVMLFLSVVRTWHMAILAVDRFLTIFYPFTYPQKSAKPLLVAAILSWVLAFIVCGIPLPFLLDCYAYNPYTHFCYLSSSCSGGCLIYNNLVWWVVFVPPCVLPMVLTIILYFKVLKVKRRVPNPAAGEENLNIRSIRESKRTTTYTFCLYFTSAFALLVPPNMILMVIDRIAVSNDLSHCITIVFILLNFSFVVLDLLVIVRNKDSKEALEKLKNTTIAHGVTSMENTIGRVAIALKSTTVGAALEARTAPSQAETRL